MTVSRRDVALVGVARIAVSASHRRPNGDRHHPVYVSSLNCFLLLQTPNDLLKLVVIVTLSPLPLTFYFIIAAMCVSLSLVSGAQLTLYKQGL